MPASRDKEFRRAPTFVARPGESSRAQSAPGGGSWLRLLLSICLLLAGVLLVNGCSAGAPSTTANTTTAATQGSGAGGPATAERSVEVRANGRPSTTAANAGSSTVEASQETTRGAAGVANPAQTPYGYQGGQDGGGAASAAYEGFYEVLGARPKGFEQFGNFMIRAPKDGRISGAVVPVEGELYEFARAALDGRKLTFTTQKVAGVSYSFDGQFLAAPPFASNKKTAVAEGSVRKFRGDQVAAEASMKFYYDEGGEGP